MYIVYTKPNCAQCDQAKKMLMSKGFSYIEKIFDVGQLKVEGVEYVSVADFKAQFPQAKTAPQILEDLDGNIVYVGGFTELRAALS